MKEGAKGKMQEGKEKAQDWTSRAGDTAHGQYRWNCAQKVADRFLFCDFLVLKEGTKEKMQEGKEKARDVTSRAGDKAHGQ